MAYLLDNGGNQLYDSANFRLLDSESLWLITDRTVADVQYTVSFAAKGINMTESEIEQWLSGLKGAYNHTDLNRVEGAVRYVSERMQSVGWFLYPDVKLDWKVDDFPSVSEMERYLNNIRLLRAALPVGIPDAPPNMDRITYETANTIEKILLLLDNAVTNIMANVFYGNELYSGEVQ